MGKRKQFTKIDSTLTRIEHSRDTTGRVVMLEVIPPANTEVVFPKPGIAWARERFDFGRWYGVGIDVITYVCQRQIERFLATHDGDRATATVCSYCENGLVYFLPYCALVAKAQGRPLELSDINRALIGGYLRHLASTTLAYNSQRCCYKNAKSVLVALGMRGVITIVKHGDDKTFPRNPYPNSNRRSKGEKPLTTAQRKAFAQAVKSAVMPLLHEVTEPTSELLGYALLIIALHTGRNTTPLLELTTDCLRPHPKENVKLLVLYKRRGSTAQRVPVRESKTIESMPTVWTGVVRLIERIKELTLHLREEVPQALKDRLWLYRSQKSSRSTKEGQVIALANGTLFVAIEKLVTKYGLKDANGKPLRLNISVLRQTFANRMFELLDGDLVATASATGNSPAIAGQHYMKPGEHAERNWKFMGNAMQDELVRGNLGATEKTPAGRCSDSKGGQFAPKNGATCMNFLDCLRCRNYVVTGDDLYRLFSFYWLVVRERNRVDKRKWQRGYAHIVPLIDRDVVQRGLELKVFRQRQVTEARERARTNPHPFWATPDALEALQ
jgi:hypothetical protein